MAAVGGAGAASERKGDRLDVVVLDIQFAPGQQRERKRGAAAQRAALAADI